MDDYTAWILWHFLTRLGEAAFIMPMALVAATWLALSAERVGVALKWLLPIAAVAVLTVVTKMAFMGWGIGIRAWDFTGISGHAVFSSAIYPVLFRALAGRARRPWPAVAVACGYVMAVLIAVSRIELDSHTWSEVIIGLLAGGAASALALLWMSRPAPWISSTAMRVAWVIAAAWIAALPARSEQVIPSQGLMVKLALHLAGRETPFRREDLYGTHLGHRGLDRKFSGDPPR